MKILSDLGLMQLIKEENHLAFTVFVDRYWDQLYQHVFYRIRQEDDAKDAVQEIFISFWKNKENIICDQADSLAPYLFKSAKYRIIDYFSRPKTLIPYENVLSNLLDVASDDTADEDILIQELQRLINNEVTSLPDRLQLPYRMSREQQLSIREIAGLLQLSEQTVKNNISTVLLRLKAKIGQYNSNPTICLIIVLATLRS